MISIIVPVYNVEKYLKKCVNSIINQTYTDFELILVDDGSTDNSREICDEYLLIDRRIKVFHKENGGLSSARNMGLKKAKGEFLTFIDSDDIINKKYLEIMMKTINDNQSDVIICNYERFSNEDEISDTSSKEKLNIINYTGTAIMYCYFDNNIDKARYVSSCWKLYKSSLFHNIEFPIGRLFEDEFTIYKILLRANKITEIDTKLYYYRINYNGITQNLNYKKRIDHYDALLERIMFLKNKNLIDLYNKSLLDYLYDVKWDIVGINKSSINSDLKKEIKRRYQSVFKLAKKNKLLSFYNDYDIYILSNPKITLFYRIKRLVVKLYKSII